ncbi:hypothetical protein Tco_1170354, partial [Tanacetum coccineum]
ENHREEEDQEGNNSSEIEALTYHVLATYGSPGDMSPGNVAGDKSGTKTRSEFTDSSQNVKHKKLLLGDFNSITTASHPPPPPAPPPQNPPPPPLLTT